MDDVTGRLGPRIRARREQQGLTVADLSARSGVGRATVADVERSARTPTLDTLAKLSRALGVPMPHFLDDGDAGHPIADLGEEQGVDSRVLSIWVEGGEQVEVHRVRISGAVHRSPAEPGTLGYVTVTSGSVTVGSAATPRRLDVGGQLAFAADQPHVLTAHDEAAEIVLVMRHPLPGQTES